MDWLKIARPYRIEGKISNTRTEFERDQDRIIFSLAFKKLNDKTQVFPIPENQIVHSRMTHSLESSSVGRSIGQQIAEEIALRNPEIMSENPNFAKEIGEMVKTAALTHDIGNPPFGHSGEDAISHFYRENQSLLSGLSKAEKQDLLKFEGNAQGFRLLTNINNGLKVTANILAAFTKYPRESIVKFDEDTDSQRIDQKKYGAFQAEKNILKTVFDYFELKSLSRDNIAYLRHPLAYIVEAADDFCYLIMDMEDSVKLRIMPFADVKEFLISIIRDGNLDYDECYLKNLENEDEKVGYLRAKTIQSLIRQTKVYFLDNLGSVVSGDIKTPLSKRIQSAETLQCITDISVERIYNYRPVLEIEAAGFEVLGGLLEIITDAVLEPLNPKREKIIQLLPGIVSHKEGSQYDKLMRINDYVSGMTDNFAIAMYRKLKGISLPRVY
ncbi:MAG: dNTP triphosphohydrolase [Candidatus Marinimicrobia bacterium]|nr:dNTP triphosphohydrolase [Candidatus Neomarinimicrobiota bacterium]